LSARPFVESAHRAGYRVTVIDAYADIETLALAELSVVVDCDQQGFNAEALLTVINDLDASQYLGFVYGSGFEAQPELLQKISTKIPLLGNAASTVAKIKTAFSFFASLQQLNIPFPSIVEYIPAEPKLGYLKKFAAGCGGTHISWVKKDNPPLEPNCYFQEHINGCSVSLLFLADGKSVKVIGFNEQWLSPSVSMPFRYGGAVSQLHLATDIQLQLITSAQKITLAFGLVGLNSLDAIVAKNIAYILEVNPRLTATVALYAESNLLQQHILACLGQSASVATSGKESSAHAVVYAPTELKITKNLVWPDWAADIPDITKKNALIKEGDPVCTIVAQSLDAESAKQLVQTRVKLMQQLLEEYRGTHVK
jgi:predicted ATP-grasp superfamily ATP-dependent carboligase